MSSKGAVELQHLKDKKVSKTAVVADAEIRTKAEVDKSYRKGQKQIEFAVTRTALDDGRVNISAEEKRSTKRKDRESYDEIVNEMWARKHGRLQRKSVRHHMMASKKRLRRRARKRLKSRHLPHRQV